MDAKLITYYFQFNFEDHCRAYAMASDVYFKEIDDLPLKVHAGDIYVFDMTGFSYKHLFKLNLSSLKFLTEYTQVIVFVTFFIVIFNNVIF